jgi:UDP-sulfoquinovose synthase
LGLNPITLDHGLMSEVVDVAQKYKDRCDWSKVLPSSFWTKSHADAASKDSQRVIDTQNKK